MRKRNVEHTCKTLFWWFIYLLPLLLFVVATFKYLGSEVWWSWFLDVDGDFTSVPFMIDFLDLMTYFIGEGNVIHSALIDVCSFMAIRVNNHYSYALLLYLSYFISMFIVHLFVDFLLFIPRLAHKWMSAFTHTDE